MLLDPNGTMSAGLSAPYGLYFNDTRYLSALTISASGEHPGSLKRDKRWRQSYLQLSDQK
jgi:hypothetical protein